MTCIGVSKIEDSVFALPRVVNGRISFKVALMARKLVSPSGRTAYSPSIKPETLLASISVP